MCMFFCYVLTPKLSSSSVEFAFNDSPIVAAPSFPIPLSLKIKVTSKKFQVFYFYERSRFLSDVFIFSASPIASLALLSLMQHPIIK